MRTTRIAAYAASALLAMTPLALARGRTNDAIGPLKNSDRHFLDRTAQSAAFELQASQLAEQKAQASGIRQFAQMVVNDHKASEQKTQMIAQDGGVTLPTGLTSKDQSRLHSLQKLNGRQFDQAYLQDMRELNRDGVTSEEHALNQTKNQQIRQLADADLRSDQTHLQKSQHLSGMSTSDGPSPS